MPTAHNDGVELVYERHGPDDAETVVFVEGIGYGRWMWCWQRRAVAEEYDTIVWDNRGTGDSAVPEGPYTMEQMASDLSAVLDAAGVDAAHVVGASMGGMITLQFALDDDRAESLTLMCTSPGGPDAEPIPESTRKRMYDIPEELDEREERRYKMDPAMTDEFMQSNGELLERIIDWRIETDASDQARLWQGAAVEAFDVSDKLAEIREPALVVHGTGDRVVPVENGELLAEGLQNAELVELQSAPHLLFIERHEEVNTHLTEFLTDV
jgi:pimeloyl-ACP methyl ester carboxylesterase